MSRLWPKRKWENTQWHKSNRVKIERQFCRKRKADRTNRAQMQSAKTIVNKLNFVTRFSLENLSTKSILCRNTISVLLISQIISPLWKKKIEKSKFHQRNYRFGTASKFYLLSFSPWRYLFFILIQNQQNIQLTMCVVRLIRWQWKRYATRWCSPF